MSRRHWASSGTLLRLGGGRHPVPVDSREATLEEIPDTLVVACQLAGIVAALLLLPAAIVDMVFGTDFLSMLSHAVLAAFAASLIVAIWAAQKSS